MEKNSNQWLSISAFMSKSNWHLVIKDVIQPFIKQLFQKGDLYSFKLEFDYQSGENIRLSLLVPNEKKYSIAQSADQYFREFFKTKQLLPTLNSNENNTIFMPFLINCVQYGLYSTFTDSEYLQVLEHAFSTLMVDVFAEELIDDEAILTFALYVLFDSYKLICATNPSLSDECRAYYQHITNHLKTTEFHDDLIQEQYSLMETTIEEIYSDTINNTAILNDLAWINIWEDVFSKIWKEKGSTREMLFFSQINLIVNKQLNIDVNSQMLISAFISKTVLRHKLIIT